MKNILAFYLVFAACIGQAQRTEVKNEANKITLKWNNVERLSNGTASLQHQNIQAKHQVVNDVALLWVLPANKTIGATDIAEVLFDDLPGYKQGVALWRYKPWNSWTKPMAIQAASKMPGDDVQFYY